MLGGYAEVVVAPEDGPADPDRYIAIRIWRRQGDLFADGSRAKHFAVVMNDKTAPASELLWWQRQKAGTVEQVHRMTHGGLGPDVLPCGRFGANAAWLRLNVLTHNVLQAIKWLALPKEDRNAHSAAEPICQPCPGLAILRSPCSGPAGRIRGLIPHPTDPIRVPGARATAS